VPGSFDGGLVDLNSAPAAVIARLPGVGAPLAKRIVKAREEVNGFASLDDLGQLLDLDAPAVDRLRDAVVCLPRS
jgi:DNA uptake protein ComE-like DNA-binding protein